MPKPKFKFHQGHYLWMVQKLEEGHTRYRVARMFAEQIGSNPDSVKSQMYKHLPSNRSPKEALKQYVKNLKTSAEKKVTRSAGMTEYWETASPEQVEFHKEQIQKGIGEFFRKMKKEDRVKWAKRMHVLSQQQREEIGRMGGLASWANVSEAERKRRLGILKAESLKYANLRKEWIFFESPRERRIKTFGVKTRRTIRKSRFGNYQREMIISDALRNLPNHQQFIIALRVFREFTMKELIEHTKLPQIAILEAYEDAINRLSKNKRLREFVE